MELPNLSNSMYVARLRHIQSIHERDERRNPDTMVRHYLPRWQRVRAAWLRRGSLDKLRAEPFYYYLVARTKYYDDIIRACANDGVRRIVSVGCGSDTRPVRFASLLRGRGVRVLECDQGEAIRVKERLARRW